MRSVWRRHLAGLLFLPAAAVGDADTDPPAASPADSSVAERVLPPPEEVGAVPDGEDSFRYTADTYVHSLRGDSLLLRGNAVVHQRGARLQAAEIVYHRGRELVVARSPAISNGDTTGMPTLTQGKDAIRGRRILYDMDSGEGTIFDGRIRFKEGFYSGNRIDTRGEEEFHVHSGSYTTCDLPEPHFDFYSPRIKVLAGEMAIARPVYLRIGGKRVAVAPFYVFSLRENRQSGLLTPSFGQRPVRFNSSQSEWEVRNLGYYLAPSDYWDLRLSADLRQRSGWLGRVALAYARRYYFDGMVDTRIENRQSDTGTRWEWWTNLRHNQQLGESASLRGAGTFQSSKDVVRDNSTRLGERLTRTLRSNLRFNKRWREPGYSLSVNASRTENLDTGRFDTVLPEVSLRRNRRSLFGAPGKWGKQQSAWYHRIYYDGSARLRNTRRGTPADTTSRTSGEVALGLSTQQRPANWLSLSSGLSQRWRDADLRSSEARYENLGSTQARAAATLSQTVYGLFTPQVWRVTAVRHVVKPDIGVNYGATRIDTGATLGAGGRPSPWRQSRRLTMRLSNSFWLKLLHEEEESKHRVAQVNLSTSYDIDKKSRPLSDLVSSATVDAGPFNARVRLRSEFYDDADEFRGAPALRQFEINSSFRLQRRAGRKEGGRQPSASGGRGSDLDYGEAYRGGYGAGTTGSGRSYGYGSGSAGLGRGGYGYESGLHRDLDRRGTQRLQIGHYYSRSKSFGRIRERSWLRGSFTWSWRRTWHLHYSVSYNLESPLPLLDRERVTAELLSLQREFHDWTATFNLEPTRFARTRAFYFKAQLKDIPQIRFERGDRRRR